MRCYSRHINMDFFFFFFSFEVLFRIIIFFSILFGKVVCKNNVLVIGTHYLIVKVLPCECKIDNLANAYIVKNNLHVKSG